MLRETFLAAGETNCDYEQGYNPIVETTYNQPVPYSNVCPIPPKAPVEPKRKESNPFVVAAAIGMSGLALYFGTHAVSQVAMSLSSILSIVFFGIGCR